MTVSKIRTESNKRKGWKNILHFLCAENQNQWISKIICLDLEKHTTPYIPNTLSLKSKNSKCLKPPVATDEGWTEGPDSKLSSRIQILSYFHFHPSYSQLKIEKKNLPECPYFTLSLPFDSHPSFQCSLISVQPSH